MKLLFICTSIILSQNALAEYRAYQYLVHTNDPYALANKAAAQFITSTLNPAMFQSYHGGTYVKVELLRTWICPGYTGSRKAVCPHPYDEMKGAM